MVEDFSRKLESESVQPAPKLRFAKYFRYQAKSTRSQHEGGGARGFNALKLSRIEPCFEPIEPLWMNGFKLRGIDAPLIRCDLQPVEDRW